jgi:hypothetical protein
MYPEVAEEVIQSSDGNHEEEETRADREINDTTK